MSVQGRAWHRLCRTVWRVSANSHQAAVTPVSCAHLGETSILHHPSPVRPPPSPPTTTVQADLTCGNVTSFSKNHCEFDSLLDVSLQFGGLSVNENCTSVGVNSPTQRSPSLASWPSSVHLEYICPSEKLVTLPELVILEQLLNTVSYDLPQTPALNTLIIDPSTSSTEIAEPTIPSTNTPKEAREIMKIRRKKMKRHLLKKFRKRMAFTLRKIKRARRKKKEAVFQARLATIKDWGDSFDARAWVQEELDKARKGGFYVNVLEKKQS